MSDKLAEPMESEPKRRIIIRVDATDLPQIKNWEVGKKYKIEGTIKMLSKSEGDPYPSDYLYNEGKKKTKPMEASFEMIDIDEAGSDDDDDEDDISDEGKQRARKIIDKKRY